MCLRYGIINLVVRLQFLVVQSAGGDGLQNTSTASLQRGKIPLNKWSGYDTKRSYSKVLVMLELWGMQSTPLLPLIPGPLWPRVVAPDRVLSISQIELNSVLMLNWIVWNRTVHMYKNGFGIKWPTMADIP